MTTKRKLTEQQEKDADEMAGNFGRTLGSNQSDPEESDEDFFRSW